MKNKTLPALILSIAVLAGVMTSITDAYAQTTNTERLMTVVDTTGDTNSMVAMIQTMLADIQETLNGIVSSLTGLADGQDAIMDKQDALSASLVPLTTMQEGLGDDTAAIQSKIDSVSMMLDDLEMTLSEKISALETSMASMQAADTDDHDLEAAVNNLNQLIQRNQAATDDTLSALQQSLNERLTSIETQLGGVTENVAAVEQKVETQAATPVSAAKKGTAKTMLTLADYASNVDDNDYNDDAKIDYNLKFECEETVYINDIKAEVQGTDADDDADTPVQLTVYHVLTTEAADPAPEYRTFTQVNPTNPFALAMHNKDTSSVKIPDIQLTDIVLVGEFRTVPAVQRPITLEASDSFTIATSLANDLGDADADANVMHIFYESTAETRTADLKELLDLKIKIDEEKVDDTVPTDADGGIFIADPDADNTSAIAAALKKADGTRIQDLAKKTEILEISVQWFSAVSDPKCTFTPIGEATVDYPNQDNTLNLFTTIENIAVSATVACNGVDTRIESIDDIRIGGSITNHEVGSLTLSAGGESIKINLTSDLTTFELDDEDADFPLKFSDTLQIDGVLVPESSPASLVIEIMYDTGAGNTCTQQ